MKAKFRCLDCRQDTSAMREFYFVHTELWLGAVGSKDGMLCIGCLETRIGRELTSSDFTSAYINRPGWGAQSARLLNRLTRGATTLGYAVGHDR